MILNENRKSPFIQNLKFIHSKLPFVTIMSRFLNSFNETSIETNMIWGLLLALFGFVLAIVLSFKIPGTFLSIIGIVFLVIGLFVYGRAFYRMLN